MIALHADHVSIYDELLDVNHANDFCKIERGPDGERQFFLRGDDHWIPLVIDTDD